MSIQLVESVNIEGLLANNMKKFEAILPKNLTAKQLFRLAIIEIGKNPELGKCTTVSLIGALMQCAQVGLEIGTGKAYLVPYKKNVNLGTKDKPNWKSHLECQFQIGYKGIIELALRSAKIAKISAQAVFANDYFYIEHGTNERLEHRPLTTGDRGEFMGAYSIAKTSTGEFQFDFMRKDEIDAIKDRSKAKSDKTPWHTDYYEMARKTPTKRLCKYLPSSSELLEAIAIDDEAELDFKSNTYDHEPAAKLTKTDKIRNNLETQKAQEILDSQIDGANHFEELSKLISKANSLPELELLSKKIGNSNLSKAQADDLIDRCSVRSQEIKDAEKV